MINKCLLVKEKGVISRAEASVKTEKLQMEETETQILCFHHAHLCLCDEKELRGTNAISFTQLSKELFYH